MNGELISHESTSKWMSKWTNSIPEPDDTIDLLHEHRKAVANVAASVRSFHDRGKKFRIYHGSTNSTLHADEDAPYALVQPNVPMDRLVEETLKYNLIPPVVMEFPGITVGGGYAGTSGESSSFKHGFFDQTLDQIEIVLANGDVVTCSEDEHRDLFRGAAGAVGTLGVTTLVRLRLRKACKYVETTYHPVKGGMDEAMAKLNIFTNRPNQIDYLDGIMFSKTRGAIITGRLTDDPTPGIPVQRFSAPGDPWFYLHVQDKTGNHSESASEAVPLPEYLFRYDRGGFWVGAAAFDYFKPLPFNSFTRWFLDDFLHTRMLYNALHSSGQSERLIVQDLALPYASAKDFVDFTDSRFNIYPLWLCPLKQSALPTMHPHLNEKEPDATNLKPMLNIGLWGLAPPAHKAFLEANRDLEAKLLELGGMKWLYAQTYYTEEEFWSQFDKSSYDALRDKYHASSLATIYEKVHVKHGKGGSDEELDKTWTQLLFDMWPVSGLYGLTKSIESREYMKARDATWKHWVPR
ncbi:hypothetical protein LTR86_008486 [Recurvomyces mirabilis]|nr:hypothetical protein LTR86_008486 [Recurvomyces mirabilis]